MWELTQFLPSDNIVPWRWSSRDHSSNSEGSVIELAPLQRYVILYPSGLGRVCVPVVQHSSSQLMRLGLLRKGLHKPNHPYLYCAFDFILHIQHCCLYFWLAYILTYVLLHIMRALLCFLLLGYNMLTKANRGGTSFPRWLTLPHQSSSLRGVRPRDAYWLAPPGLFNLLSYRTEDPLLIDGAAYSDLGLLYQSLIKDMLQRPICWRQSLSRGFLFPPDSNLFQVTKTESRQCIKAGLPSLSLVMWHQKGGEFAIAPCPAPRVMPAMWELNKYEWMWRMAVRLYLTLANGHRKPDPSGHVSSSELFEGWEPRVPLAVRCMQTCSPRVCCYLWVNKLPGIGSPISISHCCSFGHCP